MGVAHALKFALKTIAHRGRLLQRQNTRMADKNMGHSNFIVPDP
jgi:hypothetical protein